MYSNILVTSMKIRAMGVWNLLALIWPLLFLIGKILPIAVPLLICIAMLTMERKVIAAVSGCEG